MDIHGRARRPWATASGVAWIACLSACAHTYATERPMRAESALARQASFYVALSEPGSFEGRSYPQSSMQTALAVESALSRYASRVEIGGDPEDFDAALASAERRGLDYAVVPVIAHWEDRATEWSGKSDRILVKLHVAEVATHKLIDSSEISARSRWATFGGDHPQDLLREPVDAYVASLFE